MRFKDEMLRLSNEYSKVLDEMFSYNRILQRYSTFDRKNILRVLSSIASSIEGVSFSYIIKYSYEDYFHHKFDFSVLVESNAYDNNKGFITDIGTLEKLRKVLFIDFKESNSSDLCFYELDVRSHKFGSPVNFEKFPYLEEFIDEVVAYRIKNKLEKISIEELESLKRKFLVKKLHQKRKICGKQIDGLQDRSQNKKIGIRRLVMHFQSEKSE